MGTSPISNTAAVPAAHKSLRCIGRFHHAESEVHIAVTNELNRRDCSPASAFNAFPAVIAHFSARATKCATADGFSGAAGANSCACAKGYNEAPSASAVAYRSAGFLARQRITMRSNAAGKFGLWCEGGGGVIATICAHTALTELPLNGCTPVVIWNRMIPSENKSERVSCAFP